MLQELNLWITLLVFVISLPVTVISGAAMLGFRDTQTKASGLLRLLVCAAILLLLLLLFGAVYYRVMLAAFALVIVAHLASYWGLRRWVRHR